MPDSHNYITKYAKYFNLQAPKSIVLVAVLLLIGALYGTAMSLIVHYPAQPQDYPGLLIAGLSTGLIAISLPALLTAAFIKAVNRRMRLKHALFASAAITILYGIALVVAAAAFLVIGSVAAGYLIILVANAFAYGYWFIVGKFAIGRGRASIAIAATQPVLNTLLFIPLSQYVFSARVPLGISLIKLSSGMLVFLVAGYVVLYAVDRPVKRNMDISGIKLVVSMVGQWLYNLTNDVSVIGKEASIKRDLSMDVLAIKGRKGYKAVFVNPDIHFGPFAGVGGSVAPAMLGTAIAKSTGSAPFVLHSPLMLEDNPISTTQVRTIERHIEHALGDGRMHFRKAYGSATVGRRHTCTAINVAIGDANLLLLTRAPRVTEDMNRELGMRFKYIASAQGKRNVIVVDAHNSRFESASTRELDGVQAGSQYARDYESAIRSAMAGGEKREMSFGAAQSRIAKPLGNPKDVGEGYTSACVFGFGDRMFGLICFDANNMLPGFRSRIIDYARARFGMEVEVCTTDTHSINSLSMDQSNALGRHTSVERILPIVDSLLSGALESMEPARYAYRNIIVDDFAVWGKDADALIERTSQEVKRLLKYAVPALIAAAFIIASWVIYIV